MEEIRRKLAEDLTDVLDGDVRTDDVTTALYSSDASLYEIKPLAVVFPRHVSDVSALAAYASENNVSLTARGAGTGLAGGCLGSGVIVDFTRYMNRVLEITDSTVRVQPGITLAQLNRTLRPHGRCFAADPSNAAITTIGGMIGVDAAGSHAFRVGSTRDHLRNVQCVLMGGQTIDFGREPVPRQFAMRQPDPSTVAQSDLRPQREFIPPVRNETLPLTSLTPIMRKQDVTERIAALLAESSDLIRQHQPLLLRNCSGYMLRGVLEKNTLDLPRLIGGSEGTLGMVTEATLHTMPIDRHGGMMVLMFGRMDDALQTMQQLLILEPSACDIMDRRLLSLGRGADRRFEDVVHPDAEAGLFIEFNGTTRGEIERRINDVRQLLNSADRQFVETRTVYGSDEIDLLWQLPAKVVSLLAGLKGSSRPLPFVEDIAVPPEAISGFLTLAQKTLQRHEVTATLYAHAASGQLHLRPILPLPDQGSAARIEAIARDLYRHVKSVGGAISGEHGDGLSRTAFLRSMYGPLYRTFQQLKEIFDPQHLLNPNKIISNDGRLTIRNLRKTEPQRPTTDDQNQPPLLPVLQLTWQDDEAMAAASRCNGCGSCRTTSSDHRMCPFFRQTPIEEFAPRSKANLLRRLISGEEPPEIMSHEAVRAVAESCFNCKQCQLECPSGVDIPHLMLEARAQNVATDGLSKTDWLLSRFHTYARFASRFTMTANRLLRHRVIRKILQKTIGIAEQRRLPQFTPKPFMQSQRVRSEHNSADISSTTPTVLYFVDYFANHHDPDLSEAFVRILQHNGYRVYVPTDQTVSGMAMITVGDLDAAREVAESNIAAMSEAVREGFPVVCSEPSAALCIQQEYPLITKNPDALMIARNTFDAGTFLWNLHQADKLKTDFNPLPLTVAYHTPCHVKALGPESKLAGVLELVPELKVRTIEKGCSGMAGTFGLAAEHFEQSMRIGRDLCDTMKDIDVNAGVTDCSSCRMQMEQEASVPTVHPLKILAFAYGLMPELSSAFESRPSGYLMS